MAHYQFCGGSGVLSRIAWTPLCVLAACIAMLLVITSPRVADAMNNFTLDGINDYRPYGPLFPVGGYMIDCNLRLEAPIADVWFKSLTVNAAGDLDSVAGGIFDGVKINLRWYPGLGPGTGQWSGDGTSPFSSNRGIYSYNVTGGVPEQTCSGRGTCLRESKAADPYCACDTGFAGSRCEKQIFEEAVVVPVVPAPDPALPSAIPGAYNGLLAAAFAMATTPGAGGPFRSVHLQLMPGVYRIAHNETFFVVNDEAPSLIAGMPSALKIEAMPGSVGSAGAKPVLECDGHSREYALFSTYKHLHLTNVDIRNCFFPSGPGGSIRSMSIEAHVVLNGVSIANTTSRYAGAVYMADAAKLEAADTRFENNTALDTQVGVGGAVYSVGTKTEMQRTEFIGNHAGFDAGGMYLISTATSKSNDAIIDGCTFEGNSATSQGAALVINDVLTTISNTVFRNNTLTMVARARAGTTGSIRLTEETGGSGAGVVLQDSMYTLSNVIFEDNTAETLGGALYASNGATVFLEDTIFRRNRALMGGAIGLVLSAMTTRNVTAMENEATIEGGAIAVSYGYLNVLSSTDISNNWAREGGGGIALASASVDAVEGALTMRANVADNGGGLISTGQSRVKVPGAALSHNVATTGNGGALMLSEKCDFAAANVTCSNNEAANGYGGCMYVNLDLGIVELGGAKLMSNRATYGGGAALSIDALQHAKLVQMAFYANSASVAGGAVFLNAASQTEVSNFTCPECTYGAQSAGYGVEVATHPVRILSVDDGSAAGAVEQQHEDIITPFLSVVIVDAFDQTVLTDADTRVTASLVGVSVPLVTSYPYRRPRLLTDEFARAHASLIGATSELSSAGASTFSTLGVNGYFAGVYAIRFSATIQNPFVATANGMFTSQTNAVNVKVTRKASSVTFETVDTVIVLVALLFIGVVFAAYLSFKGKAFDSGTWMAWANVSSHTAPMVYIMLVYAAYVFIVIAFLPSLVSEYSEAEHDESLLLKLCIEGFILAAIGVGGVALLTTTRMSNRLKSCLVVHSKHDELVAQEVVDDILRISSHKVTSTRCNCADQQQVDNTLDVLAETEIVIFIMSHHSIDDVHVAQVLFSAYDVGLKFVVIMSEQDKTKEFATWSSTKGSLKMMMAGKTRVSLLDKDWLGTLQKRLVNDEDEDSISNRTASVAYRGKTASLIEGDRSNSALTMLMNFSSKVNSELVASLAKRWTIICASLDYGCLCWIMTVLASFVAVPRWRTYVGGDLTIMLLLGSLAAASGIVFIFPSTLQFLYHYRTTKLKRDITRMYTRRAVLHTFTTILYVGTTCFIFMKREVWYDVGMPGAVFASGLLFAINSAAHLAFAYVWVTTCRVTSKFDKKFANAAQTYNAPMSDAAHDLDEASAHADGADNDDCHGQGNNAGSRAASSSSAKVSTSSKLPDELLEQVKRNNSSDVRPESFETRNSDQVLRSGGNSSGVEGGGARGGRAGQRRLSLMQEGVNQTDDANGEEKPRDYDVFLSYKHANMSEALAVAKSLESEGFSVWLDTMIEPGENWREQVAVSLERSKVLVFLATDMAIASQFCQEEIFYAKELRKPLLPLTLDASCFDELKLHKQLNATLAPIQFIDFRNFEEGLAVLKLRLQRVLRRRTSKMQEPPQAAMLPSI